MSRGADIAQETITELEELVRRAAWKGIPPILVAKLLCGCAGDIVKQTVNSPDRLPDCIKVLVEAVLHGAGAKLDEVVMMEMKGGGQDGN